MCTRGARNGAKSGGIDAELLCMVAHEAHSPLNIINRGWIAEAWRRAVIDREDGVSSTKQRKSPRINLSFLQADGTVVERGLPPAAGNEDHAVSVGFVRAMDIHQKGQP